jgi:hypothetical protein
MTSARNQDTMLPFYKNRKRVTLTNVFNTRPNDITWNKKDTTLTTDTPRCVADAINFSVGVPYFENPM